jgi:hypothetical protein
MEEEFNSQEDKINMALVAHEVGFEAIEKIVDYYTKMLVSCFINLADYMKITPTEVRTKLEKELGLDGAMETYLGTLHATTVVSKSVFDFDED